MTRAARRLKSRLVACIEVAKINVVFALKSDDHDCARRQQLCSLIINENSKLLYGIALREAWRTAYASLSLIIIILYVYKYIVCI